MLPPFKYHPDPIATGAVKPSEAECECCGQTRGFTYAPNIYAEEEIEDICPWCVADGSAADKFDGTFSDDYPLTVAELSSEIVDEVTRKTPGFISWQQEEWQICCNDACEFHGDASREDVKGLSLEAFHAAFGDSSLSADFVGSLKENYGPGGDPAIYKWRCRHCGQYKFNADFS
ncbi:MAG: CbrC family protein [Verrucomicrobia subdivision 3 bacterium]|nr:CbrC family protein [Limisphaerales bacterium]